MVVHQCAKGVIIVHRHTFSCEYFAGLGRDYLVSSELNGFAIKSLELDGLGAESLLEGNLVMVDKIVT